MTTRLRNKLATAHEEVSEAYRNGATLCQIGEFHGVSSGTVRNILKELGVEMRSRGRQKKSTLVDSRMLPLEAATEATPDETTEEYEGNF